MVLPWYDQYQREERSAMYEDDDDWDEDDDDWDEDDEVILGRAKGKDPLVTGPQPWTVINGHQFPVYTGPQASPRTRLDQHDREVSDHPLTGIEQPSHQLIDWVSSPSGVLSSQTVSPGHVSPDDWYSASIVPASSGRGADVVVHHGPRGDLVASMGANRVGIAKLLAQAAIARHSRGADMETGRILQQGSRRTDPAAVRSEVKRLLPVLKSVVTDNRRLSSSDLPTDEEIKSSTPTGVVGNAKVEILNKKIDSTVRSTALLHAGTIGVDIEDWADPEPTSVQVPEVEFKGMPSRRRERETRAYNRAARSAAFHGVTRVYFD